MKVESVYHVGFTVSDIPSEGASTAPSEASPRSCAAEGRARSGTPNPGGEAAVGGDSRLEKRT